jgi:acyl carrier protein
MPADLNRILQEVTEMLRALRDDIDESDVTMDATFRSDLGIESIDVVALAGRLQSRYGSAVNFATFIAGLGLDVVRELKVGELVTFIAESLDKKEAADAAEAVSP